MSGKHDFKRFGLRTPSKSGVYYDDDDDNDNDDFESILVMFGLLITTVLFLITMLYFYAMFFDKSDLSYGKIGLMFFISLAGGLYLTGYYLGLMIIVSYLFMISFIGYGIILTW